MASPRKNKFFKVCCECAQRKPDQDSIEVKPGKSVLLEEAPKDAKVVVEPGRRPSSSRTQSSDHSAFHSSHGGRSRSLSVSSRRSSSSSRKEVRQLSHPNDPVKLDWNSDDKSSEARALPADREPVSQPSTTAAEAVTKEAVTTERKESLPCCSKMHRKMNDITVDVASPRFAASLRSHRVEKETSGNSTHMHLVGTARVDKKIYNEMLSTSNTKIVKFTDGEIDGFAMKLKTSSTGDIEATLLTNRQAREAMTPLMFDIEMVCELQSGDATITKMTNSFSYDPSSDLLTKIVDEIKLNDQNTNYDNLYLSFYVLIYLRQTVVNCE